MQVQVKPRLYADVNKQMNESYYNYEDYEIEYGYQRGYSETLIDMKSSLRLVRENIQRFTQVPFRC